MILGAGASYDSIDTSAVSTSQPWWRPPLASQLFEDRGNFNEVLDRYPQFIGRVPDLRRKGLAGGLDVERELESIKAEAAVYPPAQVELAAMQFYLRDILIDCTERWQNAGHGATNYADMLSRIERWRAPRNERVAVVTFNYDTLVDLALEAYPIRMQLRDIGGYVAREDWMLIRPHGSVRWGRVLRNRAAPNMGANDIVPRMIEHVGELEFTDEYVAIAPGGVTQGDRLVFPAIAIPVQSKSAFACPPDHLNSLTRWLTAWRERREQVDDLTHILVIGWRGSEDHFLGLFQGRLDGKRVLVVGENEAAAQATSANLARAGLNPEKLMCSRRNGFTAFLSTVDLEGFLNEGSRPPVAPAAEPQSEPPGAVPVREEYLNTAANRRHLRWTWCSRCQHVYLSSRWAARQWAQCPNIFCVANGHLAVQWEAYLRAHRGLLQAPLNQPGDGEYRPASNPVQAF